MVMSTLVDETKAQRTEFFACALNDAAGPVVCLAAGIKFSGAQVPKQQVEFSWSRAESALLADK